MIRSLVAASVAAATVLLVPTAAHAAGPNLAAGKTFTASSSVQAYQPGNAGDGNTSSYWESTSNAFPQYLQVDLGASTSVNQAVLKLPPATAWDTRTQTLSIQGSADGSSFSTLSPSAGRVFNPATGNAVTIDLSSAAVRFVRVAITANTGWPAGQLSELEVYGPGGTDPDPPPPAGSNLAAGKPIEASSVTQNFVAANANDDNTGTYWEGGAYPATLTVKLGANVGTSSIVVKLNPDPVWGQRTQTFSVLGREQNASAFTTLVGSATYTFNPSTGNTVTVPVSATAADLRLSFTGNSGAPSGQVAEFQVFGTPAPNPDLTVTALSASPSAPVETDAVTLSATVRNAGNAGSPASNVNFYLGTTKVGTTNVGALAAGASATVTANIGARNAGTYALRAVVDEANTVVEQNDANNAFTGSALTVSPVASSDLVASVVTWSPSNPSAGNSVAFSVTIQNQGTSASAGGAHGITLTLLNESGGTVQTMTGSYTGTLAPGASSPAISLGSWTAANGKYTVRVVLANDANELPVKQANNTSDRTFFVGRGANMPYDMYEAEDGQTGGGAQVLAANRRIGDLAGEASGRRAVTLPSTGSYVQWTTKASTNTVVARFSIPDGTTSSINVYVNGSLNKTLPLTSKYAWLYGPEAQPQNSGTGPRHIYDEANIMLTGSFPGGSTIKLQKDGGNAGTITIDFINTEQVAPIANPNPSTFVVPAGFDHQSVQNALDAARQDTSKAGVYLPAGDYATNSKFSVYGRAIQVVGAGPWYTRFFTPQNQTETDAGFRAEASANGSTFKNFGFFGNWTIRQDGPGKVFDFNNVANMTVDNIWTEHQMCLYWGANVDNMVVRNSRIRNMFADGINMTNGSTGNLIDNVDARATGDDSFALFAAIDSNNQQQTGNVFQNLSSTLTWRAAGLAVYGGQGNTFKNIYIADTLVYSGVTIASIDFGIPMLGFGSTPTTNFDNISIVRAGGHFWGQQTFPALWVHSGEKELRGIRISNVDIVDPTYHGIMFQTKYSSPTTPLQPITDTVFTNVSVSGAQKSGDEFDAKSGFGIWANPGPEQGQGPAVGSATFTGLRLSNNWRDIENTTSTFTINRN
ncbi:CARDB domain-containing protein [Actinoplanes sp. NPDC051470]|uniref:galactose-binding domain-containing protein n=1 Tax=Actinoplanes sp. NPDC051470 TaxID=3157224 RepID=UPI0034231AF2